MKLQNWAGTKVPVDHDLIYAQVKYYLLTVPKEKIFPEMAMRASTQFVRKTMPGKELTVVEIGVHLARNSYNMLRMLPIKKLYCIDPYAKYDQDGSAANAETDTNYIERMAHKRLVPYNGKVTWIRDYSGKAADQVPFNLDFVYIDGNHTYENVLEDIELYYPHVRSGGVIGGHDFDGSNQGVARASIEFTDKHKLKLHGGKIDFWFVKK
jgi:hypothetical protein